MASPRMSASHAGSLRLREAAERGDGEAVQAELGAGAPIDGAGRSRWTALHRAADRGHVGVVRLLCEAGANPNIQTETGGDTALHIAASRGDAGSLAELLRVGADPRLKSKNGWTALHAATFYKHDDAARILLRNGADPSHADSRGLTADDIAAASRGFSRSAPPDTAAGGAASDHISAAAGRRRRLDAAAAAAAPALSPGRRRLDEALQARREQQLRTAERRREAALREQQEGDETKRAEDLERLRRKHERRQELQTSLRIQSPAPRIGGATVSSEQGDGAAKDLSVSFAASAAGSASSPGSSQTTRRQRLSTGTDGAFLRAGAAGSEESESESESDDEDSGDEHGREAIKQEMLSRVWQAVDADGNGSLDRAEIEKVLREMMGASDDGDVESTLDRLDLDGDGVLSFVRSPAPRAVILAERCCGARQEEFSTWFMHDESEWKAQIYFEVSRGPAPPARAACNSRFSVSQVSLNTPSERSLALAELRQMLESGEITEETRCWVDGMDDWQELRLCREQLGL